MDDQLKQAVLGAANITPSPSPLGADPTIAGLFSTSVQLPTMLAATDASGNQAQLREAERKRQAAEAKAAAARAKAREEDMADIKKYRKGYIDSKTGKFVAGSKDDGGFDFFDPDGNQVDIATVTKRTGTKPRDLIDDSDNPIDQQYLEDYNNLNDFVSAALSGNKSKVDSYITREPRLKDYQDRGGVKRLLDEFRNNYRRYYVPREEDQSAWGQAPRGLTVPYPDEFGDSGEL